MYDDYKISLRIPCKIVLHFITAFSYRKNHKNFFAKYSKFAEDKYFNLIKQKVTNYRQRKSRNKL